MTLGPWQVASAVVADRMVNSRSGDEVFVLDIEPPDGRPAFRTTLVVPPVTFVRIGSMPEVGELLTVETQFRRRVVRLPASESVIHRFLASFPEGPMML